LKHTAENVSEQFDLATNGSVFHNAIAAEVEYVRTQTGDGRVDVRVEGEPDGSAIFITQINGGIRTGTAENRPGRTRRRSPAHPVGVKAPVGRVG